MRSSMPTPTRWCGRRCSAPTQRKASAPGWSAARRTSPGRDPFELVSVVAREAEQLAGDDDALHLLGALTDVEDLHVPVELLEHPVIAHPGLAEDVERRRDRFEDNRRR